MKLRIARKIVKNTDALGGPQPRYTGEQWLRAHRRLWRTATGRAMRAEANALLHRIFGVNQ